MLQRSVRKTPGCSSIVVDGATHEFIVSDHSHGELEKIHTVLKYANNRLNAADCLPDTSEVLLNIDEE